MINSSRKKLTKVNKISYAIGQVGETAAYNMFYLYFVFFLTDIVGLEPAFAGLVSMVGVLWDAFTDPVIGVISDRARFKSGRRRPFLFWFAIPFGISTGLLYTMFDLGPMALKIYFIFALILFFTCYTLFFIPYAALGAEMTLDYHERTSLHSYRGIGITVGIFMGAVVFLLLTDFYGGLDLPKSSAWSYAAFTLGAVAAASILFCWAGIKGTEIDISAIDEGRQQMAFIRRYTSVLTNRPFRFIYAMLTTGLIGQTFYGAILIYYATYYMGLDTKTTSTVMAVAPLSGLIFAPLVNLSAQKYGKKMVFAFFVASWGIVQTVAFFITPGNIALLVFLAGLTGGGIMAFWILLNAMTGDATDVDEWITGERREGLYFGIFSLLQKVAAAVTMALVGAYLSLIGYVANAEQIPTAISGIRLGYSVISAIPFLLSATICLFYPITSKKHNALREALNNRADGKPYSTQGFEDLINSIPRRDMVNKTGVARTTKG